MFKIGDIVRYSYNGYKIEEPLEVVDIDGKVYILTSLKTNDDVVLGGESLEIYTDYYRRKKLEKICSKLEIE